MKITIGDDLKEKLMECKPGTTKSYDVDAAMDKAGNVVLSVGEPDEDEAEQGEDETAEEAAEPAAPNPRKSAVQQAIKKMAY